MQPLTPIYYWPWCVRAIVGHRVWEAVMWMWRSYLDKSELEHILKRGITQVSRWTNSKLIFPQFWQNFWSIGWQPSLLLGVKMRSWHKNNVRIGILGVKLLLNPQADILLFAAVLLLLQPIQIEEGDPVFQIGDLKEVSHKFIGGLVQKLDFPQFRTRVNIWKCSRDMTWHPPWMLESYPQATRNSLENKTLSSKTTFTQTQGFGPWKKSSCIRFISFLPPWQKEVVMFLVELVCLSICLSVCCLFVCLFVCLFADNITQKVMNGFWWNFQRGLGKYNEGLIKIWWWSGPSTMSKWPKNKMAVAWPDRGAVNDSEPLGLTFHHQGDAMHSNIVAAW